MRLAPSPRDIPTLQTEVYLDTLRHADRNGDHKTSKAELQSLKASWTNPLADVALPFGSDSLTALNVLLTNFSTFAGNRGQRPGSAQTMEFRMGEDDQIRENEVISQAGGDGHPEDVSYQDVHGPYVSHPPTTPPRPYPPPRPNPQPSGSPLNGFYQQLVRQLIQYLLRFFNPIR